MTLLEIGRLSVTFRGGDAPVHAVEGLTLALEDGERLGLLGESGSGKTVTARAIAGLVPEEAAVTGAIRWPALGAAPRPGRDIGFVFQDPMSSLNPVLTVGEQIGEVLETHLGLTRAQALDRAIELLARVDIPEPRLRVHGYPHECSGGQRQRVAIAIAIAAQPRLLIADEPTSSLDTIVQAQVMALLDTLAREHRMALLLITHDVALAARAVDRIAVLYAGRLAETGSVASLVTRPRHPYTRALLAGTLDLSQPRRERLPEIPGALPAPGEARRGCPFAPRCPEALPACRDEFPPWTGTVRDGVACWRVVPAVEHAQP
jgi:oligopeptide/dipeptide ABC transporter ATP-binding protein